MITPEELYHTFHAKPFRPLRVHVADGRVFDIRNERMAVVGETYFQIGIPSPHLPEFVYDYTVTLPLDAIVRVEHLQAATTATP
jgi:hypothetical protein